MTFSNFIPFCRTLCTQPTGRPIQGDSGGLNFNRGYDQSASNALPVWASIHGMPPSRHIRASLPRCFPRWLKSFGSSGHARRVCGHHQCRVRDSVRRYGRRAAEPCTSTCGRLALDRPACHRVQELHPLEVAPGDPSEWFAPSAVTVEVVSRQPFDPLPNERIFCWAKAGFPSVPWQAVPDAGSVAVAECLRIARCTLPGGMVGASSGPGQPPVATLPRGGGRAARGLPCDRRRHVARAAGDGIVALSPAGANDDRDRRGPP